jgi:hypothetical protein
MTTEKKTKKEKPVSIIFRLRGERQRDALQTSLFSIKKNTGENYPDILERLLEKEVKNMEVKK